MKTIEFSLSYGKILDEKYSIKASIDAYKDCCTFIETVEVYSLYLKGMRHNKLIVCKALKDIRNKVLIATKLLFRGSKVVNDDVYVVIKNVFLTQWKDCK